MFGFIIGYLAENILLKFNSDRRLVKHNSICNKDFPLKELKATRRLLMSMNSCTRGSLDKYLPGEFLDSSTFEITLGGIVTKWSLRIFPNGDSESSRSYIALFLVNNSVLSVNHKIKFKLGLFGKNANYMRPEIRATGKVCENLNGGYYDFISHDFLLNKYSTYTDDGSVTFFCDLTITQASEEMALGFISKKPNPFGDYKKMFGDRHLADFELKTSDGESLKAHKVILAARSPMFYAMLTTAMKEAKENYTIIPDFDSFVIEEVLRYIYYNEVENLDEYAGELVFAAEKYQLDGLKELCVDKIILSLTKENVLEWLENADRLTETGKLFKKCLNLIISHFNVISATEEWKQVSHHLMTKIIHDVIRRDFVKEQSMQSQIRFF